MLADEPNLPRVANLVSASGVEADISWERLEVEPQHHAPMLPSLNGNE